MVPALRAQAPPTPPPPPAPRLAPSPCQRHGPIKIAINCDNASSRYVVCSQSIDPDIVGSIHLREKFYNHSTLERYGCWVMLQTEPGEEQMHVLDGPVRADIRLSSGGGDTALSVEEAVSGGGTCCVAARGRRTPLTHLRPGCAAPPRAPRPSPTPDRRR
ncbi:hypothetical protein EVAR_22888_1 [Eumeta japonica]|uniref:Uncharacterized protein n=1 Tax=Eumeta variegata TaxID=151549 RepID=A0A4C1UU72_EUMVA|nr:hypothetical protein EVAR_22888_1 [Eumeta japonica]